jgi:hypothetical protein
MLKRISSMTQSNIRSVYSGVDGKCCCGCAGKHHYNSQLVKEASVSRGYEVTADEINDKMITKVLTLMKKNVDDTEDLGSCISLVVGKRLYVAYLAGVKS